MSYAEIEALADRGVDDWLDEQFGLRVGSHLEQVEHLMTRWQDGDFAAASDPDVLQFVFRRYVWWHMAQAASDDLRQRVAFALSETFVVSDRAAGLDAPRALPTYYDVLLTHAFGNYRDLLRDVTLSPAMGTYLSHVNNGKADPANNIFPDENYAREVMQLFSIGLFELNTDGSLVLDANDQPIPTYSNTEIREFAKVFTGLSWAGDGAFFGNPWPNFLAPMIMFEEFHEPGENLCSTASWCPTARPACEDIEAAIDNLFNHPNVGPFIGSRLIQRLVTSNPSPAYVERVANVFNDNGDGVRGDLQAVFRAILLDPDATAPTGTYADFGKLREPIVRLVAISRMFTAESTDGIFYNGGYFAQSVLATTSAVLAQCVQLLPAGTLARRRDRQQRPGGPGIPDHEQHHHHRRFQPGRFRGHWRFLTDTEKPPFGDVSLNIDEYIALAPDVDMLIDRLDIVMTYGTLTDATRDAIRDAASAIDDMTFRTRFAIYLMAISPDYAVQL